MKRKILTVLISGVLCISVVACNQAIGENSKQMKEETEKTNTIKEAADSKLDKKGIKF